MSEITTLAEYATIQGGYAYKSTDFLKTGKFKVLKIKNIRFGYIDYSETDFISDQLSKKTEEWKTKPKDILISMTGSGPNAPASLVGRVARVGENEPISFINQRIGRVIVNEKVDSDYIYYLLSQKSSQEYFVNNSTGSANQVNINGNTILSLEVPCISFKESKKIAQILNTFDDKIQLNTQINQTLEQIAQALFKSWFVDFDPVHAKVQALSDGMSLEQAELAAMQAISGKTPEELTALSQTQPEHYAELVETAKAFPCEMVVVDGVEVPKGWEVKPLGDLISFVKGKKPKSVSPKQEENMLPHILTSSLEGKYNEFCESNKLVTIEYHNTIMLMDGSNSGRIAIGHNGVIGSTLAKINLDNNKLWAVIYQFLKYKEADIQANTTGTTIPHTDKNRVNNYLMVIPDNFLLEKFTNLFDNSLLKIISNRNQIISLETTRDLLLPRLLNGVI